MTRYRHRSWVTSANDPATGNPITHLPYGVFFAPHGERHLCIAIGDQLLDLTHLPEAPPDCSEALKSPTLNALLELGPDAWKRLRGHVTEILSVDAPASTRAELASALQPLADATLAKPLEIPNYTDFFASLHHATRVGQLFRPDQPLLPNYQHLPIGYNGRASSITMSGTPVRRPWGQTRPTLPGGLPGFAPTAALDFELEMAFVVGVSNPLGTPIAIDEAQSHLFGVTLLNDWSARDIQSWEYQPLGPFLGKSFATTISPWITPMAALAPFEGALLGRPDFTPPPLNYLGSDARTMNVELEVFLVSGGREERLSGSNLRDLFWTPAQLVAHHTSNGCNLEVGDLLASGTISGLEDGSAGCLLELTRNGTLPLRLSGGEMRPWLEDGDEVVLRGTCRGADLPSLHLGECRARILPAHS